MNTEITLPGGTDPVSVDTVSTVISFYQVFVGRQPDLPGLQFWSSQLESGLSINEFADAFAERIEESVYCAAAIQAHFLKYKYNPKLTVTEPITVVLGDEESGELQRSYDDMDVNPYVNGRANLVA